MSGPHFRDYHLLLDDHASQIFAMVDPIAERGRKLRARTLTSIGEATRIRTIADNDAELVGASDMLSELLCDNQKLAALMREVHRLCSEANEVATTSLLENWIDETENRVWFLSEASDRSQW